MRSLKSRSSSPRSTCCANLLISNNLRNSEPQECKHTKVVVSSPAFPPLDSRPPVLEQFMPLQVHQPPSSPVLDNNPPHPLPSLQSPMRGAPPVTATLTAPQSRRRLLLLLLLHHVPVPLGFNCTMSTSCCAQLVQLARIGGLCGRPSCLATTVSPYSRPT